MRAFFKLSLAVVAIGAFMWMAGNANAMRIMGPGTSAAPDSPVHLELDLLRRGLACGGEAGKVERKGDPESDRPRHACPHTFHVVALLVVPVAGSRVSGRRVLFDGPR